MFRIVLKFILTVQNKAYFLNLLINFTSNTLVLTSKYK